MTSDVTSVPPRTSPTFGQTVREMIGELADHRDLLVQLTLRDIRIRYKQAVMGFGWAVLMPVLIVAAGVLVRYAMARVAGTELDGRGVAGVVVKAIPWAFFVGAVGFATTSLTANVGLVTKVYLPREVFPLSAVLAQAFDSAVGAAAVASLPFLLFGVTPSLQLLWLLPLVVLTFLLTAGAALVVSCANLFFRDVKYLVQVVLTFGIFFTPVFYEPAHFGSRGVGLMMLNPLAPLLEGCRLAVVERHSLLEPLVIASGTGAPVLAWHPGYLLYAAVWAALGCLVAWFAFHKLEPVYAEYI